jgi:hypothetical protein
VIAVVASIVVLFNRPVTVPFVVWTVIVALLAVAVVELLRRPADEVAAEVTGPVGSEALDPDEAPASDAADGAVSAAPARPAS